MLVSPSWVVYLNLVRLRICGCSTCLPVKILAFGSVESRLGRCLTSVQTRVNKQGFDRVIMISRKVHANYTVAFRKAKTLSPQDSKTPQTPAPLHSIHPQLRLTHGYEATFPVCLTAVSVPQNHSTQQRERQKKSATTPLMSARDSSSGTPRSPAQLCG